MLNKWIKSNYGGEKQVGTQENINGKERMILR